LKALLAEAGVKPRRAPTSEEVAFRVAPRLNAAGRLDTAEIALSLLEERDAGRAAQVARELSVRNAERQTLERRVVSQARERIAPSFDPERDSVLVAWDASWHRGVLGIAASRLAREYHRPVLLFGVHGERATGSGRSVPGVSLHAILKDMEGLFDEFGGHDQAVGGSLAAARLPELRETARAVFAARVPRERLRRRNEADADLPLRGASDELMAALARFEPHGAGNPRPVFRDSPVRADQAFRPLGEKGLRGRLCRDRDVLAAITWEREDLEPILVPGQALEIHYRLGRNRYGEIQAEIAAARPCPPGETVRRIPEDEGE
jgi:single-stranded-DNA-specific exonuclease